VGTLNTFPLVRTSIRGPDSFPGRMGPPAMSPPNVILFFSLAIPPHRTVFPSPLFPAGGGVGFFGGGGGGGGVGVWGGGFWGFVGVFFFFFVFQPSFLLIALPTFECRFGDPFVFSHT